MRAAICVLLFGISSMSFAQQAVERRLIGPSDKITHDDITYPLDLGRMGIAIPRIIGDNAADKRLADPRTIFYRLPKMYQQWTPSGRIKHVDEALGSTSFTSRPPVWNIFDVKVLSEFNANLDFPWETTFGLNIAHRTGMIPKTYDVFNFLSLPEDDDGRLIPIIVLADERPLKWIFPPRTMFGEVIYVKHGGRNYIQEIRTRTKSDTQKTWFPGVYRPIKNRAEFQALTGLTSEPAKKFFSFRNPEEDEVFLTAGFAEKIPDLPEETVKALLSRPFQDVLADNWSPMSESDFNILPKDYSFGILGLPSAEVCASCHRQTGISVRHLIPKEPLIVNNPSFVGNIRGYDGIFTWHPFSPMSILSDAKQAVPFNIYLRAFDARNGIVQIVHKGQGPDRKYLLTQYVQKSLKDYELPTDCRYLHDVCKCGDGKCKCTSQKCCCSKPRQWTPYVDNRRVSVYQPDQMSTMPLKEQPRVPEHKEQPKTNAKPKDDSPVQVTALPSTPGSKYTWYSGEDKKGQQWLYLYDNSSSLWLGYYNPRVQQYRTVPGGELHPVPTPLPKE